MILGGMANFNIPSPVKFEQTEILHLLRELVHIGVQVLPSCFTSTSTDVPLQDLVSWGNTLPLISYGDVTVGVELLVAKDAPRIATMMADATDMGHFGNQFVVTLVVPFTPRDAVLWWIPLEHARQVKGVSGTYLKREDPLVIRARGVAVKRTLC